jgi:hypothetical protein
MRTLLVRGKDDVPPALRAIVDRGSTTVDEVSAHDLSTYVSREGFGVDRIVFWAGSADPDIRTLAWNYATAEGADRRQTIVYVTRDQSEAPVDGMGRDEVFIWPRDEDKLKLILTTGG